MHRWPYLISSPRKIKRVVHLYQLVRRIIPTTNMTPPAKRALLRKLLPWIILCEQWPVRMSWSIQLILNERQSRRALTDNSSDISLLNLREFYNQRVRANFDDVKLASAPDALRSIYQKLSLIDGDQDLFESFMDNVINGKNPKYRIFVADVGFLEKRDYSKLVTYTINLNPAFREVVQNIISLPRASNDHLTTATGTAFNPPIFTQTKPLKELTRTEVQSLLSGNNFMAFRAMWNESWYENMNGAILATVNTIELLKGIWTSPLGALYAPSLLSKLLEYRSLGVPTRELMDGLQELSNTDVQTLLSTPMLRRFQISVRQEPVLSLSGYKLSEWITILTCV